MELGAGSPSASGLLGAVPFCGHCAPVTCGAEPPGAEETHPGLLCWRNRIPVKPGGEQRSERDAHLQEKALGFTPRVLQEQVALPEVPSEPLPETIPGTPYSVLGRAVGSRAKPGSGHWVRPLDPAQAAWRGPGPASPARWALAGAQAECGASPWGGAWVPDGLRSPCKSRALKSEQGQGQAVVQVLGTSRLHVSLGRLAQLAIRAPQPRLFFMIPPGSGSFLPPRCPWPPPRGGGSQPECSCLPELRRPPGPHGRCPPGRPAPRHSHLCFLHRESPWQGQAQAGRAGGSLVMRPPPVGRGDSRERLRAGWQEADAGPGRPGTDGGARRTRAPGRTLPRSDSRRCCLALFLD